MHYIPNPTPHTADFHSKWTRGGQHRPLSGNQAQANTAQGNERQPQDPPPLLYCHFGKCSVLPSVSTFI